MSDWERIAEYMRRNPGITGDECKKYIGTSELRRRICDLKDRGFTITDIWECGVNRVGKPTRFKRYFLLKEPS